MSKFAMKKTISIGIALVIFAAFSQLARSDDQAVYIDVRTWLEYKVDHIDGDIRIHVSDIVDGVTAQYPDKETPIKLYCERGVRAEAALQKLKAAGYLNVENVGGIDEVRELRLDKHAEY